MGSMASQITSLTIVYSAVYSGAEKKDKAPRHWPLGGEFTGDRWIPRTNDQQRGKCFHLMTSSWLNTLQRKRNDRHSHATFSIAFSWIWNTEFQIKSHWNISQGLIGNMSVSIVSNNALATGFNELRTRSHLNEIVFAVISNVAWMNLVWKTGKLGLVSLVHKHVFVCIVNC